MKWIVKNILRPQWVVYRTEDGMEVGVRIFGVIFGCYKAEPYYPTNVSWRLPEKRELGETLMAPYTAPLGWDKV